MTTQTQQEAILNETFRDSFMKPEIIQISHIAIIDGNMGCMVFDASEIGLAQHINECDTSENVDIEDLPQEAQYNIAEAYQGEAYDLTIEEGFMYRLSAPGYLDSTDYSHASTYDEAVKNLLADYAD